MRQTQLKYLLILIGGLLFLTISVFVGIHFYNPKTASSPKDVWSAVAWEDYASSKANVSFEYPNGWIVTDLILADYYSKDQKEISSTNSLWVCPPENEIVAAPKEGLNNCITFFVKSRILNPMPAFFDESTIFKDFIIYIQDPVDEYDDFRIMEQESSSDHDGAVNLIGLYRARQNFIGISQMLCSEDKTAECILVFKHVLDSIKFLN
jgi:hypothetical protein